MKITGTIHVKIPAGSGMEPKKLGAAIAQILASQTGHKVDVHVRTISKGASLSSTINRNMHKQM